jgi:tetratricopeptide (TPR) repeat protein
VFCSGAGPSRCRPKRRLCGLNPERTDGDALRGQGEIGKAEAFFNQALEMISGSGIPFDTAELLNNLGAVYHAKGNLQKAEDFLKRALKMNRRRVGTCTSGIDVHLILARHCLHR